MSNFVEDENFRLIISLGSLKRNQRPKMYETYIEFKQQFIVECVFMHNKLRVHTSYMSFILNFMSKCIPFYCIEYHAKY